MRKAWKTTLLSLFCLALLLCLFPAIASAEGETSGSCGDNLTWSFNSSTGKLTITGSGDMDDFDPNTTPWVSIQGQITSVSLPKGLTSIGECAFSFCTQLASVTIPNAVTRIGHDAFYYCSGLTSVTIPSNVNNVGDYAFAGCTGLTSVNLQNTVIGRCMFCWCEGLTSVTIPARITSIDEGAFFVCTSLVSFQVAQDNQNFASVDGVLFSKDKTKLICYPPAKKGSYSIPGSVTSIDGGAFETCSELTSVSVPDGVTEITEGIFNGCTSLTSIQVAQENPNYVSVNGVLFSKDKTRLICYPAGKSGAYSIPTSVAGIGYRAFEECAGLTSVTIPNSVTSIDAYAFSGCTGLTSVTVPGSITDMFYAFMSCDGLTSVTISEGVTCIHSYAFSYCRNLTSLTLPGTVTSIYYGAFGGCTNLKDVNYAGTAAQKAQISVEEDNSELLNATWHYSTGSKPTITTQPKSVTVNEGAKATFKVVATGADSYKWQYQKPGSSTWTDVSNNGTSATYTLTTAARHNGYKYRCKVTNAAGTVTSSTATLTIGAKPTITTQPEAKTVTAGAKATFKVVATGATGYKWQYQKPGSSTWTDVSNNGTSDTYSLTTAARHNGYKYRCKVTNAAGTVTSSVATLTIGAKPTITTQPKSVIVNAGAKATFKVVATGATGYKWQYQKPGETAWRDVANNGTSATYTLTTAARHNGYKYRCRVTNAAGTVTSSVATLTIGAKPTITTQPKAKTVTAGAKATFQVVATGADSYKWQYQKPGSSTWTDVSKNGTSATYSLTTAARHNGYKYRCKVTNSAGTVYTSAVKLTVK